MARQPIGTVFNLGELIEKSESRILLIVMDGLGDARSREYARTPLEAARTPNLDRLAADSSLGRLIPVLPGITPGSGPGHLALFGYDPTVVGIGRGVLEAVGLDVPLEKGDVAARGNFCTLNGEGIVTDRRAGRIPTEKTVELCKRIQDAVGPAVGGVTVVPGMSHRFCAVFRGKRLSDRLTDADPQKEGRPVPPVRAADAGARSTAAMINEFSKRARKVIRDEPKANGLLLRGFSRRPDLPSMEQLYGVHPACIATYPMYRGLARLVGMDVQTVQPAGLEGECATLEAKKDAYSYFYFHWKATDQAGEDGNFPAKVAAIEQIDAVLPRLLETRPDVVAITGDHSSPVPLKGHSWHPVPVLIWSRFCGGDGIDRFTEVHCNRGSLGIVQMKYLMPLLLAHAMKLKKFGA